MSVDYLNPTKEKFEEEECFIQIHGTKDEIKSIVMGKDRDLTFIICKIMLEQEEIRNLIFKCVEVLDIYKNEDKEDNS